MTEPITSLISSSAPDASIAGPAHHPAPTPLKPGSLRPIEHRIGAYAYRDIPSLMGGSRVPYVSSLIVINTDSGTE